MRFDLFHSISPFVRIVKKSCVPFLSGRFVDFDYVITMVESGEADYSMEGVRYPLKKGDVALMAPYVAHSCKSTSAEPLQEWIVHFDMFRDAAREDIVPYGGEEDYTAEKKADAQAIYQQYLPEGYLIAHPSLSEQTMLKACFAKMYKEAMDKKDGYSLLLKAYTIELLTLLFRCDHQMRSAMKQAKTWGIIERVVQHIQEHYADGTLDNTRLSTVGGVTPNYLSNVFAQHMGVGVHTYMNYIRTEKAKELILSGDNNLTEAAYEVGFSSVHVFSKVFKRMNGISPSEYIGTRRNRAAEPGNEEA